MNNWIDLIAEVNIGLLSSDSNIKLTIRKSLDKNINVNSYHSNSLSSINMGEIDRSNNSYYALNIGYKI